MSNYKAMSNVLHDNIWRNMNMRDNDIIIASTIKSGTTWLQQIVAQLMWETSQ